MVNDELFDSFETDPDSFAPASSDDMDSFLADLKLDFTQDPELDFSGDSLDLAREPELPQRRSRKPVPDEPEPEEEARQGSFFSRHHRAINLLLLLLCLVLSAGIAAVILLQSNADPLEGRIMENVYVAGVNVGGLTKEEAADAVNAAIGTNYKTGTMEVLMGSSRLSLPSSEVNPNLSVQAALNEAYSLGRTGSTADRQKEYRQVQNSPLEVVNTRHVTMNMDYVRRTVSAFLEGIAGEYSPSGYHLDGQRPGLDADSYDASVPCQTLVLELGTPGSGFDLDGICQAIFQGYCLNQFQVTVPDSCLPQFPQALDIDAIYHELCSDPVEASEENGSFQPGSCGYRFDLELARAQLSQANYGDIVSIPMEYVMPGKLDNNGTFTESLSRFTTPLSTNEAYNENMKTLCKKLDGLVLNPGDTFSFHEFFPELTKGTGYQTAPRHAGCCIEEELGGGMDQVASTLYVAAKLADVTVQEKYPADHLCTYLPKGTEITVGTSWQDLKLNNSLSIPVRLRARVTSEQVLIQFLSEKPLDYYVKLEPQEGYSIAHGTAYAPRREADGFTSQQVLVEGVDGCQVTLNWVKYSKTTNKEIGRTSEYALSNPMKTVVVNLVG